MKGDVINIKRKTETGLKGNRAKARLHGSPQSAVVFRMILRISHDLYPYIVLTSWPL
jgi:hypothetical protein